MIIVFILGECGTSREEELSVFMCGDPQCFFHFSSLILPVTISLLLLPLMLLIPAVVFLVVVDLLELLDGNGSGSVGVMVVVLGGIVGGVMVLVVERMVLAAALPWR